MLDHAVTGGAVIKRGRHGPEVALLQGALVDLGYKLPKSTKGTGAPDGLFGFETESALTAFQTKVGITADGMAGKKTIGLLDQMMSAKAGPSIHVASPSPPPAPRTQYYQLGVADPRVKTDRGAGL